MIKEEFKNGIHTANSPNIDPVELARLSSGKSDELNGSPTSRLEQIDQTAISNPIMLISNPLVSTSAANGSPNGVQQLDGQQFELTTSPNGTAQTSLADQQTVASASVISSVGQVKIYCYKKS